MLRSRRRCGALSKMAPRPRGQGSDRLEQPGRDGAAGAAVSLPLPHRTHTYGQMQGNEGRHPNTWGERQVGHSPRPAFLSTPLQLCVPTPLSSPPPGCKKSKLGALGSSSSPRLSPT